MLRIVAEAGVDAVTHRRVAEVAELPLASTTYWFESKEHLLTAALARAAELDVQRLHALVQEAQETPADPLSLAVAALVGSVGEGQKGRGWLLATYALVLEAARRPALREVTTRWTAAYLETLAPLLRMAGSTAPSVDARLLLAAADGLLVDQLASDDELDIAPLLRRLVSTLVKS